VQNAWASSTISLIVKSLNPDYEYCTLQTPFGKALLGWRPEGLAICRLLKDSETLPEGIIPLEQPSPLLAQARQELKEYFDQKRDRFSIELYPEGTPFQQKVWDALLQTEWGETMSYLELSKKLGDPKAIRAVASANGQNPLWIFIPCHRIIGSNGELTGYAWGLECKSWLLNHESKTPQLTLNL